MTKEQLENTLYERMSAENKTFLADLKAKPVDRSFLMPMKLPAGIIS